MRMIAFSLPSLWWSLAVAAGIALLVWQWRRLHLSPLRGAALGILLIALLNPMIIVQPQSTDKAAFNLQIVKPRVLLVEYGGGKTFLGTVLSKDSPASTDIISPDDLPLVTDMLKKYDVVALHTTKNMQVYTDFLSDWHSFPNRGKLESVFSDYGVVFENGTQVLSKELDNYGLIVLAGSDIKPEDTDRLTDYVDKGGRVLILLHAAGGKAINPPGNSNPYCILYHHPPYGDRPFPEEWLQRNTAAWLMNKMGIKAMENIACTYGKMVVQKSGLTVLSDIYGGGALYPNTSIDGKEFDKLDWTTAFIDYDPAWQPLLKVDTRYTNEPTGHGTPVTVSVEGKAVALGRQYGKGSIFIFGYCSMNYGASGIPASMLLTAAPYIGAELSYDNNTSQALANYVASGGNLVVIGPSIPRSSGNIKLTDLLPVNISGPQSAEDTKTIFRNASHPVLSGISPFIVSKYRLVGLKANGEALAVDGKNNPVLVTGYYGMGKVVYYLPEIPVQATLNNTAPPDFWRRLTSWLSPSDIGTPGRDTALAVRAGPVPLSIQIADDQGKPLEKADVSCEFRSPDGIYNTARLKETSSGVYAGQLDLNVPGEYSLVYHIRAGTVMKTAPVTLTTISTAFGGMEQSLWNGIAFLDGYHSTTPMLIRLPLWQLLVAVGVCLLCINWVVGILRGKI